MNGYEISYGWHHYERPDYWPLPFKLRGIFAQVWNGSLMRVYTDQDVAAKFMG